MVKENRWFKTSVKESLAEAQGSKVYQNLKRLWPYVKPYWFRTLLAVLICIPISSLDAMIALSLKPYTDMVMVEKNIQSPWYIPFAIVAFTAVSGILNYFATYLNTWVGSKITHAVKFDLFSKMLSLETSYFDTKNSGDIIFTFNNNADQANAGLLMNLKASLQRIFTSVSLVGVLFYNSWQLAVLATIVLGYAFLPAARIRKRILGVMGKSIAADSAVLTAYNEAFAGNKTITSYNLDNHQKNKFSDTLNRVFNLKIKMTQRTSWLSPIMHTIVSIGIAIAIGYGSHLVSTGQITSGNFVSFLTALVMLYTPVKNIGNNISQLQLSFLAMERVFEALDIIPTIRDKVNAKPLLSGCELISFEKVCFGYRPGILTLNNIDLKIQQGETVAFVGNSGGGKTTLLNLLLRFYDVRSGSIKIDGVDIRDYTLASLRKHIAVVFQDNFLFSGSIRDNIILDNQQVTAEQLTKALEMSYLKDFIDTLEVGMETQIGERGILLSGGQKQRVAIARAFIKSAPIVILDEATSSIDNKAEAVVQKAIDNLMYHKTVLVVAHRLSTVQNADKIVVINKGEIAEVGKHQELLALKNGVYRELYRAQFKKIKGS